MKKILIDLKYLINSEEALVFEKEYYYLGQEILCNEGEQDVCFKVGKIKYKRNFSSNSWENTYIKHLHAMGQLHKTKESILQLLDLIQRFNLDVVINRD